MKAPPRTGKSGTGDAPQGAKTTVANCRLIAVSGRKLNIVPLNSYTAIDSTHYSYSGTRGTGYHDTSFHIWLRDSTFESLTRQAIVYDTPSLQWLENATFDSTGWGYSVHRHSRYRRSRSGNDSLFQEEVLDSASRVFLPYLQHRSSFTPGGRIQDVVTSFWNVDSQRYVGRYRSTYSYDAAGRTTVDFKEKRDPSLSLAVPDSLAFIADTRTSWSYDAQGNTISYLSESTFNGPLQPVSRELSQFHSSNQLQQRVRQTYWNGVWSTQDSMYVSFDPAGNPFLQEHTAFSGGVAQSIRIFGMRFDAAGRVLFVADSTQVIGGTLWYRGDRDWYQYDAAGRQIAFRSQRGDRTGWNDIDSGTVTYSAAGLRLQEDYWTYQQNGWQETRRTLLKYATLADSVIYQRVDPVTQGFQNSELVLTTYNTFQLPTRITNMAWNGTAWVFAPEVGELRYYYETYDDGIRLSVASGPTRQQLGVYPVPASVAIRLKLPADAPDALQVRILNAGGQSVRAWRDTRSNLVSQPIAIDGLPSGRYYIYLEGSQYCAGTAFTVAR